jgi:hypothetical protein
VPRHADRQAAEVKLRIVGVPSSLSWLQGLGIALVASGLALAVMGAIGNIRSHQSRTATVKSSPGRPPGPDQTAPRATPSLPKSASPPTPPPIVPVAAPATTSAAAAPATPAEANPAPPKLAATHPANAVADTKTEGKAEPASKGPPRLRGRGSSVALAVTEQTAAQLRDKPSSMGDLVQQGALFSAPNGAPVSIEEKHHGLVRVRILEGAVQGREGWARANQVSAARGKQ